jgi:hypothetical protein
MRRRLRAPTDYKEVRTLRKYLIAVLAVVAATSLAMAATAAAAPNSTLDTKFLPDNPGLTLENGGLFVETTTLDSTDAGTPYNPLGPQPTPTDRVILDFDDSFSLTPTAVPQCNAFATFTATTTTQAAMKACANSLIGGGAATICINNGAGGCVVAPSTVTAFNGPTISSRRTVGLLGRNDQLNISVPLIGVVKTSPLPDMGRRLDVDIPALAGGAASITDFTVTINNGKYLRGQCNDGNNTWDVRALFDYTAGPNETETTTQACT